MRKVQSTFYCCIFLFSFLISCSSVIKTPCVRFAGNQSYNEIVYVQKHPEKYYQDFVGKSDVTIKAAIDVLDKIKISDIDATVKRNVIEFRDKLNQHSGRTRDYIKLQYSQIQSHPCDTTVQRNFEKWLAESTKRNDELEKINIELSYKAKNGNIQSGEVQKALDNFKAKTNDSSLSFSPVKIDSLTIHEKNSIVSSFKFQRGWFNNDQVNGVAQLKAASILRFPTGSPRFDSVDLNKDFVVESRVRSLISDQLQYAMFVNEGANPPEELCFMLTKKPGNDKSKISIILNYDNKIVKKKELYNGEVEIDVAKYHLLRIKKSGEYLKFYLNDMLMWETLSYMIRYKSFYMYLIKSDALVDYVSYYY